MRAVLLALVLVLALVTGALAGDIHDAAAEGDLAGVNAILADRPDAGQEKDERNDTPLHLAAVNGHTEVVRVLLDSGVPTWIGDNEESSALDVASVGGHVDVVELLIERGANVKRHDLNGMTALHFAAYNGQVDVARILLDHGADPTYQTRSGSTPLHGAAYDGSIPVIELLLDRGADPSIRNDALYTPVLSAAAGPADRDAVELLIERGADVHDRNHQGETSLMMATRAGKLDVAELLLEQGVSVNAFVDGGHATALHTAAQAGSVAVIELLVEHGADVNATGGFGWTPLAWTAMQGHREATEVLIREGADVGAANRHGITPLMWAFERGHTDIMDLLLANGADVSARDANWERTILHAAALRGREDLATLVLDHGAEIDAVDASGMTPIQYAGRYGHRAVVDLLRSRGASADGIEENYGRSALLDRDVGSGEAALWYLGHCGWGIRTANRFLIFDYWKDGEPPATPCLANGYVTPSEVGEMDVIVFVTHEHGDHFDPAIFEWAETFGNVTYVYGFRPELVPEYRQDGYPGPAYEYLGPREHATIDGVDVRTIAANDAGVGFLVEVDGLTLYHAGDHAGWADGERDGFFAEIDYLDPFVDDLDLAFVNVTGCHAHDPERLMEGNLYTLEKLAPNVMIPTHASGREYAYRDAANEIAAHGAATTVRYPENPGDSFFYRGGDMQVAHR
jgi:ankyrin repeat protein/L-ascorbate metabolism protein UlaG (beta-lactamase superfamily)